MPTQITKPETPTAPKRLTKKFLEEYFELDERRKALGRQADDIRKQQNEIEETVSLYIDANCSGKTRRVDTCGFELSIEQKPKSPSWKSLFAKLAGKAKVDAAVAAAGTTDKVTIRRAA